MCNLIQLKEPKKKINSILTINRYFDFISIRNTSWSIEIQIVVNLLWISNYLPPLNIDLMLKSWEMLSFFFISTFISGVISPQHYKYEYLFIFMIT